jgi:hypothetical protein
MIYSFHPEADTEFHEAVEYYEACESGLGYDFSTEVFSTLQTIVNSPVAWPVMEGDVRRCLVNRFPYGVLYSIENAEIWEAQVQPQL